MRPSSSAERRKYLRAYGYNRNCEIRRANNSCNASLVDISRGGMRLLLARDIANPPQLSPGEDVTIRVLGIPRETELAELTGSVRWKDGDQFGVQFTEPLRHGTAELQALISFEPDQGLLMIKRNSY
ncbi:PilZ domain-containing protein [Paucidesulfovibrio longus]|uniref:PilZ domain-containing protein n=1 Tax=Paucidesulfovibrio longus TaxID=889 RepID=UPI0003B3E372|nr:PilZ domain-containing protein [Paucidesulfovibrio longus]